VADAKVVYRRAVALWETLYAANPDHIEIASSLEKALTRLGIWLSDAGQVADAEAAYRRAVTLGEALYATHPNNVAIKVGYARSLCTVGQFTEARWLVNDVLELMPEHPDANQLRRYLNRRWLAKLPIWLVRFFGMALIYIVARFIFALPPVESSVIAAGYLIYRFRKQLIYGTLCHVYHLAVIANHLGRTLDSLGNLLSDLGQGAKAVAVYRRAVALREALYAAHPNHVEIAIDLEGALNNLGVVLSDIGQRAEAETVYRRAMALGEALYAANPAHLEMANDLWRVLNNLGNLLSDLGQGAEAEAVYRRATALDILERRSEQPYANPLQRYLSTRWLAVMASWLAQLFKRRIP
jgi:tetratricopeptide (TPR) repeat protein